MSAKDAEHFEALRNQVSNTPKVSVEEWVERAGTVIYLAAVSRQPHKNPDDVQEALDLLVAQMPNELLLVSALYAKELLGDS